MGRGGRGGWVVWRWCGESEREEIGETQLLNFPATPGAHVTYFGLLATHALPLSKKIEVIQGRF
jgi:hypothetical protein